MEEEAQAESQPEEAEEEAQKAPEAQQAGPHAEVSAAWADDPAEEMARLTRQLGSLDADVLNAAKRARHA